MIKYLRCHECKADAIVDIANNGQNVFCKGCQYHKWWYNFSDLSDQEWAKEEIRKWVAKNRHPKFFDEDGDPVMELSNAIYDMEAYVDRWVKSFVDKGMSAMELRAMTERLMNAVHVACMSHINRTEKGWPDEA